MLKATLTYHARILGLDLIEFETIGVKPTTSGVSATEVKGVRNADSKGSRIEVTVHIPVAASEGEANEIGTLQTKEVLDRVSFELQLGITDPTRTGTSLTPVVASGGVLVRSTVSSQVALSWNTLANRKLDAAALTLLRKRLNAKRLQGHRYYAFFRSALNTDSIVERYLALYRLLLVTKGDGPGCVDNWLKTAFHDKRSPRPRQKTKSGKKRITETEFSKLRHEFGHVRKRSKLDKTRNRMKELTPALIVRVLKAMEN